MEEAGQRNFDQFAPLSSTGERVVELHSVPEQPISPKDERIISANPAPDAAISEASRTVKDQPVSLEKTAVLPAVHPLDGQHEQNIYFGGYDNGTGTWDDHSNYVNANSLHVVPPAMYNDQSMYFPPGYGQYGQYETYGQFSPIPSPISPIMIDGQGQLFSPHQISVTPSYFPPVSPGLPHVSSGLGVSQTELMAPASSGQETMMDNSVYGPHSGYYLPFGSFGSYGGGGDLSGNSSLGYYGSGDLMPNQPNSYDTSRYMSPLTSGAVYPQPIGILGSYEQNLAQQGQYQGMGVASSSSARYPHGGSYQNMKYGTGSTSHWDNQRSRFGLDKGGRRDREKDSMNFSADTLGISNDRNRGPRASKPKGKNSPEDVESTSGIQVDLYNSPEFVAEWEFAKFFVIKSFSEDNVHKSIKYGIWASTPLGNRKLDAAYQEAKDMTGNCPVFLLFSVNASGQFCGIAEMVGPVDFENDAEYWQQDRWSGQFPVKWHIIKDVPNSRFRHIQLENNDNKPVTHSRDSQEVKREQGIEMLKIFKDYDADTSLIDDFTFYDEREKVLLERKAKQKVTSIGTPTAANQVNQLSDNLADTLNLEGSKMVPNSEVDQK